MRGLGLPTLTVNYEDLVAEPDKTMSDVFRFLGVRSGARADFVGSLTVLFRIRDQNAVIVPENPEPPAGLVRLCSADEYAHRLRAAG